MRQLFRRLLLGTIVGTSLWTVSPSRVLAQDDYWDNHWGWYDNTYRPYYQRRHYRYRAPYRRDYYYAPPPTRGYYYYGPSYPRYYYPPPGGGVRIGPLQFGWW